MMALDCSSPQPREHSDSEGDDFQYSISGELQEKPEASGEKHPANGGVRSNAVELYHEPSLALSNVEPHHFRRKALKNLDKPDFLDVRAVVKRVHEMTSRARSNGLCVNCYDQRVDTSTKDLKLCVSCFHINPARCHYCQLQYESTEFLERLKAPGRFSTCLDCARRIFSMGQPNFCEYCNRHCAWKSSWTGSDSVPSARFRNFCDMCCAARKRSNAFPQDCKKCRKSCLFTHPHGAKPVCINCDVVQSAVRHSLYFFFMNPAVAKKYEKMTELPLENLRKRLVECREEFRRKENRRRELTHRVYHKQRCQEESSAATTKETAMRQNLLLQLKKQVAELEGKLTSTNRNGLQRVSRLKERVTSECSHGSQTHVHVVRRAEQVADDLLALETKLTDIRERAKEVRDPDIFYHDDIEVSPKKRAREETEQGADVENQPPQIMRKVEIEQD